ncbi:MAG: ORF6N domain-containing protein [Ruminococcus sp.]|nr:ORF6N domain-containing protein [Ruminococcus sp.]
MYEIINDVHLKVKEYKGQRVVTLRDIDMVHGRSEGTARKRFNDNREHFIEGEDFFKVKCSEVRPFFGQTPPNGFNPNADIIILTENGYLMIVKSLTDKLAWKVQRELVNTYFRARQMETYYNDILIKVLENQEEMKKKLDSIEQRIEKQETEINKMKKEFSEYLAENNNVMMPAFTSIYDEIASKHNEVVRIVRNLILYRLERKKALPSTNPKKHKGEQLCMKS